MGFLRDEDFQELPDDDADAFAKLERISRGRLEATERDENGGIGFAEGFSYMNEVAALAAHFNIPDISISVGWNNFSSEFARFTQTVDFRTIQIRLTRAQRDRKNSVAISGPARQKIQHLLEKLKAEVLTSGITDRRQRSLLDKLADFEKELAGKRFDLAKAMALAALVAAAAHDFVGTLDEGPKLVHHIMQVLGHEKVEDEENTLYLSPIGPFKELPDFTRPSLLAVSASSAQGSFLTGPDDQEVPF